MYKVDGIEYDVCKYDIPYELVKSLFSGEVTEHEFINEHFKPYEQVNEEQANLLRVTFELATGGLAHVHIGTGGGGSSSNLLWRDKDKDKRPKRGLYP